MTSSQNSQEYDAQQLQPVDVTVHLYNIWWVLKKEKKRKEIHLPRRCRIACATAWRMFLPSSVTSAIRSAHIRTQTPNRIFCNSSLQPPQANTYAHALACVHSCMLIVCLHTHIHTHTHTHTHTHNLSLSLSLPLSLMNTYTHTHTYTHTNENTHTHTLK